VNPTGTASANREKSGRERTRARADRRSAAEETRRFPSNRAAAVERSLPSQRTAFRLGSLRRSLLDRVLAVNRGPFLFSPHKSPDPRPFRSTRRPNGVYIRRNGRLTGASTLDRRARFTVALRSCRSRAKLAKSRHREASPFLSVAATFTKVIGRSAASISRARESARRASRKSRRRKGTTKLAAYRTLPLPAQSAPI